MTEKEAAAQRVAARRKSVETANRMMSLMTPEKRAALRENYRRADAEARRIVERNRIAG